MVKALQDAGHRAMAVEVDITQPEAADTLLDEVEATLGPVDIFLNNAGACHHAPALDVTPEQWRDIFDINVHGLWYCAQAAGRRMQSRGGVIINIGSISAMIVNRPQMQPAYNASKAAVHQLTKSLAAEWAPYGIRVNALAPGYVKTSMAPVDDPRFKPRWIDDAPMQRAATPEELGPTIVYMASNASSFMTGSIVVVDGGYTLW
ncbi:short-chain dehydrogenase [Vreelandella olivaria]|uniref:Short-chain dehydrogenase n=1 Tax=Vreelandella olivaria TaxID=390919 RepID=A0ABN5WLN0_9GAMM|nr:short-chain dehydrogenase [Halomonas olivaria]